MKFYVIVLDSVGVGALPDADEFFNAGQNDVGSHTVNHTVAATGVQLPNLERLGLGWVHGVNLPRPTGSPTASYGRMQEVSKGKDTSTGHWEFMGIQLAHPFQVFHDGFPPLVMQKFEQAIGRGWLCNKAYSGTDVIRDFGEEHLKTGKPIVYTSADSVFQIATHEDVVPLETLYDWCKKARAILQGEFATARVIARPFTGKYPFLRSNESRKDFSLVPPTNVLDALFASNLDVIGLGKIPDIYAGRGFTRNIHTDNNADGLEKILAVMKEAWHGLAFLNLVDFDSKFGHRRDAPGYAAALKEFDDALPELLAQLGQEDVLIITSDHGNDPTWIGSDHTREHAMLLMYRPGVAAKDLGDRKSFADLGATLAQALGVVWNGAGKSFW